MTRRGGFTLIEVMVVLVIVTVLLSGLAMPLAAQLHMRKQDETRRILDDAKEALLGFAVTHNRLPCPATERSNGEESFAPGGHATNGDCETFYEGFLPAATLGLSPVDGGGFARDAWGSSRNRVRYAVYGSAAINGVANALTRAGGMQAATLPGLASAPRYLMICSTGAAANASDCGPAANQLTRRAAFVLLSLGANAGAASFAPDEARNLAGHPVFVYREGSTVDGREFDDVVQWVPVHLVVNRLLLGGRLP